MYNRVELIGRPGADPVVKKIGNDQDFASMNLATNESYKDKNTGDMVQITDWHNIVAWRHVARSLSHVKKGKLIMVIGRLKTRKYTDKDGHEKWITEVVADEVFFMEKMGNDKVAGAKNEPDNSPEKTSPEKTDSKISLE